MFKLIPTIYLQICPRTIAPNVLTFVGFLHTVANFVLLTVYDYSYYGASVVPPGDKYPPIPQWVWFVLALNQFLAHTLGKSMHQISKLTLWLHFFMNEKHNWH